MIAKMKKIVHFSSTIFIILILILLLCIAPPHIKIKERTTTFFFFCKSTIVGAIFVATILTAKGGRIWYISPAFGFFRSLRQQQFTTWMHRVIKLLGNSRNTIIIQFVSTAIPTTQVELKWAPELLLLLLLGKYVLFSVGIYTGKATTYISSLDHS